MHETLRVFACQLINEAGICLKASQVVGATAQVFFHRYFQFITKEFRPERVVEIAISCLFIACKVEEQHRNVRDLINVFDRLLKIRVGFGLEELLRSKPNLAAKPANRELLERDSELYRDWKEIIFENELEVLTELGYKAFCELPHKYILNYVQVLEGSQEFAQKSWNYLNDSLRTTLCLEFPPEVIACGAVHLAAEDLSYKLPLNPPWYKLFQAEEEQVHKVALAIRHLYTINPSLTLS